MCRGIRYGFNRRIYENDDETTWNLEMKSYLFRFRRMGMRYEI